MSKSREEKPEHQKELIWTLFPDREAEWNAAPEGYEVRTEMYGPPGSERIKHVLVQKEPATVRKLDSAA